MSRLLKFLAASPLGCILVTSASAQSMSPFLGSWGGSGKVVIDDGRTEQIKCNGYYRAIEVDAAYGVNLRCASASYSIQLRSNFSIEGTRVSGSWEERTFNLQGSVSGTIEGGRISVRIDGGPFKAAMSIAVAGNNQTVVLTAEGAGLQEVRMALARAQ